MRRPPDDRRAKRQAAIIAYGCLSIVLLTMAALMFWALARMIWSLALTVPW